MRSLPHKPSRSRTRNVESRRWKATRRRLPRKSAGFSVIRRRLPPNNPSPLRRRSLHPPPNDPNLSLPHKQPRTRNAESRRWKATRRRLPRKSAGFSVIRRRLPPNNPSPLRRRSLHPPPNDPNLSLPHKQPRTRNVGSRRWKATRRRLPRKSAGFSVIRRGLPPTILSPPHHRSLQPPPNDPNLSLPHKQPRTRNVGSRRWKATRRRLPRK